MNDLLKQLHEWLETQHSDPKVSGLQGRHFQREEGRQHLIGELIEWVEKAQAVEAPQDRISISVSLERASADAFNELAEFFHRLLAVVPEERFYEADAAIVEGCEALKKELASRFELDSNTSFSPPVLRLIHPGKEPDGGV